METPTPPTFPPLRSEHLPAILETMNDGLFTVSPHGVITSWNTGAERITGYRREEIVGRHCSTLMGSTCQGSSCLRGPMECTLFTQGVVENKECTLVTRDGERRWVLKNARVLRTSQGQVIGGVENLTDITHLRAVEREVQHLRRSLGEVDRVGRIVGKSSKMLQLFDLMEKVADTDCTVLVEGQTGTGKELVAEAIHALGPRRGGPLVKVSCSALSESLLESELFGHVKGAFTGADTTKIGRFEAADHSTVFLDEIGDVTPRTQLKLLRFLQEKELERVGETQTRRVDVRIIAATNRDLQRLVASGRFREDLYFRINVLSLRVPPLRERREDIPLLVDHFLRTGTTNGRRQRPITGCTPQAMRALMDYDWPGNVRELEHAISYAAVVAEGPLVELRDLPPDVAMSTPLRRHAALAPPPGGRSRAERLKAELLRALDACEWNQTRAARLLGVSRATVWNRMQRFGLARPQ